MSTTIIAEVGVNHNGSVTMAKELIDAAKRCGADIVKFQTFKAQALVTSTAKRANYQVENTGENNSQLEMLKSLELSQDEFLELKNYCDQIGIEFLSTAFDSESLRFLVQDIGLSRLKIPSGELTNIPFIVDHARQNLPIILSTGMATVDEINRALLAIRYGRNLQLSDRELLEVFEENFPVVAEGYSEDVTILHCTTEYPAPVDSINLQVIPALAKRFGLAVGYSDHTIDEMAAIGAVAMGSGVIEKHITLDTELSGPDHQASMNPNDFARYVSSIREMEKLLGSGIKAPTTVEVENKSVARKSLVAKQKIEQGQLFSSENLTCKRPGTGKEPYLYYGLIGTVATKDYEADELV